MLRMFVMVACLFFVSFGGARAQGVEPTLQSLKAEIESLKAQLKDKVSVEKKLSCSDGKSVQGPLNNWSPWSSCPEGSVATGLARVDIQGNHEVPTNHVNDFQCGDKGCRAWCIGNPCEIVARCCRI